MPSFEWAPGIEVTDEYDDDKEILTIGNDIEANDEDVILVPDDQGILVEE